MPDIKREILDLLEANWKESPDENLLELIGSCFAAGDISHISDGELKRNLIVLLEVEQDRKKRNNYNAR